MIYNRRDVLALAAASTATKALAGAPIGIAAPRETIRAIAFDGFPILDPRPVLALGKQLYAEQGDAFVSLFQTRLFQYQWLRAIGGHYKDFFSLIDDAHVFAASQLGVELVAEKRTRLRDAFLKLKAWPDVAPALKALKAKGVKLAFLSNMTEEMLRAGISNSGLDGIFNEVISTDRIHTYKPDPRAYQLGVDSLRLPKEQIAFAAFAGWDVAGAVWFGFPTVWVNRLDAKLEVLDAAPEATANGLDDLVRFASRRA